LIAKYQKKKSFLVTSTYSGEGKTTIALNLSLAFSKIGKVAGSKVINGEINQDGKVRLIRDGSVVYNGKILTIFREKNQTKKVSEGLECGITLKDFSDFKKKDIIEVYNSIITARRV